VLKLDRIGAHDNFFEIGGHSLLAMQITSRVRSAFGVEIGVGSIFEEATPEGLARKIEEAIRAREEDQAPPLVRVPRKDRGEIRFPLSFAQQRLWFIDQLEQGSAAYSIPSAVRLEGKLDRGVFESVINEIIRRHEILRTRFEVEEGAPVQVIEEWKHQRLKVEDMTNLTEEEKEEEIRRIVKEEAGTGFDLNRGPLIRIRVIALDEDHSVVFFTMHHIVCDEWSMGLLVKEVCVLYEAMYEGRESPLPELEIQYGDYAYWQKQYLQGERLDRELGYWRRQLGSELPALKLAIDCLQPEVRTHRAARKHIVLTPELTEKIKALSRREDVTLFMTLLAAFNVLLFRYSGQEDIIVGTAIANRTSVELEKLIGFFVNTLPFRTDLSGNPTFRTLLTRVREVALGLYAHQDIPFDRLVSELQPERGLDRMPLFRVFFVLQNATRPTANLPGLTLDPVVIEGSRAKVDLTLVIADTGRELIGTLEYNADLFESMTMKRLLAHFQTLLESLVETPDQPLSSLRLLSDAESAGQTPLDFPDIQLSQQDFETILMEIG
jgi:hypothetical protein